MQPARADRRAALSALVVCVKGATELTDQAVAGAHYLGKIKQVTITVSTRQQYWYAIRTPAAC